MSGVFDSGIFDSAIFDTGDVAASRARLRRPAVPPQRLRTEAQLRPFEEPTEWGFLLAVARGREIKAAIVDAPCAARPVCRVAARLRASPVVQEYGAARAQRGLRLKSGIDEAAVCGAARAIKRPPRRELAAAVARALQLT